MPLTLYSNPCSIHAQYARVVLDEAGVDYTNQFVDLPLGNIAPSYAKVSPALSVPALAISESNTVLTDSRDIIVYCGKLPGGTRLFPKGKRKAIDDVLDQVYSANGGQLSFQAQNARDPLFSFATGNLARIRKKIARAYRTDPANAHLKEVYDSLAERIKRPNPPLNVLSERASKVMTYLDQSLEKSGGQWLTGTEYTAADAVASIWVQWIVWANAPSVSKSPRVMEFLQRAKERPAWKKTDPHWVIAYINKRVRTATALVCATVAGVVVCWLF